jgi:hypothetical protein
LSELLLLIDDTLLAPNVDHLVAMLFGDLRLLSCLAVLCVSLALHDELLLLPLLLESLLILSLLSYLLLLGKLILQLLHSLLFKGWVSGTL